MSDLPFDGADGLSIEPRDIALDLPVAIYRTTPEGVMTFANQKLAEVLGYQSVEQLRTVFASETYQDQSQRDQWRAELERQGSLEDEKQLRLPDGSSRWVRDTARIVRDEEGQTLYYEGTLTDITAARRAEEALTDSEAKYRGVFEMAHDVLLCANQRGGVVDINLRAELMTGYSIAELKGMNLLEDLVVAEDRPIIERALEDVFSGKAVAYDVRWRARDGTVLELEGGSTPHRGTTGEILWTICSLRDVSARRRAEEELRESEERYRDLVGGLDAIVWEMNVETKCFEYVSPQAEAILGHPIGSWLSGPAFWPSIIHEDDRRQTIAACNCATAEGRDHQLEYRSLAADGRVVWIRDIVRVLLDANGRPARLRGLMIDITPVKKMEEERLRSQKLDSLAVLAGGIAHDFNNILMGIVGNISVALSSGRLEEPTSTLLRAAEKAALRAQGLTQQLLTFSKGGAPVRTAMSLAGVVRETAGFALRGAAIQTDLTFPEGLWHVEIDQSQISQVISNLMINASQAMPRGGCIRVLCRNVLVGTAQGLPLNPGHYVEIAICDEGVGIPPDDLARIFDPYFTTKPTGSGLGLATAHSIIRQHDGHIGVESVVNGGTTFLLYLPATDKTQLPESSKAEQPVAGHGHLLVMDDDDLVRDVLGRMLTALGYQVAFAENGQSALDLYREAQANGQPFDGVIMDLTIPGGMGGKETIKKLMALDPCAKAVVSSGYSTDPVIAHYQEHGFKGVISKPYTLQQLSKVLSSALA